LSARYEYKEKAGWIETRAKREADNRRLEAEIATSKTKSETLQNQINAFKKSEEEQRQNAFNQEKILNAEKEKIFADSHRLQTIVVDIRKYLDSGGDRKVEEINQEILENEANRKQVLKRSQDAEKQLQDIQTKLQKTGLMEKKVSDNIQYRKLGREIEEIEKKMDELLKTIEKFPAKDRLKDQMKEFQEKLEETKMKKHRSEGSTQELQETAKRLERELKTDLYKEIDRRYRDDMIKLKTTELAANDLEKYTKAIDVAIMKYHAMKMQEINKIIRELWVKTYRGQDIDSLEIRSEDEKTTTRSYNYRVVMIKGDTALDMRGRCSAGQKVLASIIIRLALAETFGLQCGVLALDEPTTNLDRDNIESLAESLGEIIQTRMRQNNFQLVVITHDEEFVQMLGKSEYADYYWRVSKDLNQRSVIVRENIG